MHTSSSRSTFLPRRHMLQTTALLLGATLLASGCAVHVPSNITPVQGFDVNKYAGQWYEIARIDHRFEKGLINTSAQYSLNPDGTVKVVNRGYNPEKKEWKESEGVAKFIGDKNVGALKVTFFGPFYGGYNVVDLDPAYQVSMVIGQNTDYFWLLSRQKTMPQAQVMQALQKAGALGVDLNKVILVKQD